MQFGRWKKISLKLEALSLSLSEDGSENRTSALPSQEVTLDTHPPLLSRSEQEMDGEVHWF